MRRFGGLFATLVDPLTLHRAIREVCAGRRQRPDRAFLLFRRDEVAARLARALGDGTWEPTGFSVRLLRDPKPRAIAVAPIEDRVVHGALGRLLEPHLLRRARPESFACRAGGGVHRALLAVQRALRAHRFVLHLDIRAFFPSLEPTLVRGLLAERCVDGKLMRVIEQVLESGRGLADRPVVRSWLDYAPEWPPRGAGLPVGAYTSQVLATHLVLDALDHTIKRDWKVPGYVRYVDDFILFGDSRAQLRGWRKDVGRWLDAERNLRLKHPEAPVLSAAGRLDVLGHYVTRSGIEANDASWRRFGGRVFTMAADEAAVPERVMHGTLGHLWT